MSLCYTDYIGMLTGECQLIVSCNRYLLVLLFLFLNAKFQIGIQQYCYLCEFHCVSF